MRLLRQRDPFPPVRPMFLGNVSEELGEVRMGEGSELF